MVACFTVGTACAAITANLFALQNHYCDEGAACVLHLVAAAMAWAAGALAAVSALGMAWIHRALAGALASLCLPGSCQVKLLEQWRVMN
jgi:hypothetical protein